jgi:hypothetical protein
VVREDMVDVAIVREGEDGLLQTLAEFILPPLLELLPLRNVNYTKRRDFASRSTRRGTASSNA